jgi:hypothetical protein
VGAKRNATERLIPPSHYLANAHMKLTDNQMAQVEAWMLKTFMTLPACPVCGGRIWGCEEYIFALPMWSKSLGEDGSRLAICYVCMKCSHMMLFDAAKIGIV